MPGWLGFNPGWKTCILRETAVFPWLSTALLTLQPWMVEFHISSPGFEFRLMFACEFFLN